METISKVFQKIVHRQPDKIFLQTDNQVLTYREVYVKIKAWSTQYAKKSKGNPIILQGKNSIPWMLHFLALMDAGVPVLPLNPNTKDEELQTLMEELNAAAIIDSDTSRVEWIRRSNRCDFPADLAMIFRTSGSTGKPKLAMRSYQSLLDEGRRYHETYTINHQDSILAVLPLYHAFILGMVIGCIFTQGCSIFIVTNFKTRQVQKVLQSGSVSILPLIPSLANVLSISFQQSKSPSERLRKIIIGAGATSKKLATSIAQNMGLLPCRNYGSSETGATLGSLEENLPDGIIGKPLAGVQAAIRVIDGKEMLWVKTKYPFLGHWKEGQACRKVIDETGWYNTGDWAVLDENDLVQIKGRIGSVIRRGGKFISTQSIIHAIQNHPEVLAVKLDNYKDSNGDDNILAKVMIRKDSQLRDATMRAFLKDYLEDFKIPQRWHWQRTK